MGSTLVRTVGTTDTYTGPGLSYSGIGYAGRTSLRLSNGNFIYVVADRNQSATVGQGDNSNTDKIYVYERNSATNVVTLRATIAPTGSLGEVSAALFSNNDVAIVWNNGEQAVPFRKLFYVKLTYVGYVVGTVETAVDRSADGDTSGFVLWKTKFFDVDVTDDGAVLLFWKQSVITNGIAAPYTTTGVYISVAVRTTGGSWVNTMLVQEGSTQLEFQSSLTHESVSGCALGGTSTARRFVYMSSYRIDNTMPFQSQLRIGRATVDTTTGVVTQNNIELNTNGVNTAYPNNYGQTAVSKMWRKDAASDSFVLGHANSSGYGLARGTWNGTTFSFQTSFFMTSWTGGSNALGQDYVYADSFPSISYSPDKLIFWSMGQDAPGNPNDPAQAMTSFKLNSTIVHLDQSSFLTVTSGYEGKGNGTVTGLDAIGSNGNRNYTVDSHEILAQYGQGAGSTIQAIWQKVPAPSGGSGILNLIPGNAAVNIPAQPNLGGEIDTDVGIDFTMYRIEYQFAQNNTFTVALIDYIEPVGNGVQGAGGKPTNIPSGFLKEVSFTDQPGVTKSFINTLPVSAGSLSGGIWYYRARLINEVGQVGNWSSINSFTIGHPPVTIPLAPGGSRYYTYGAGTVDVTWQFTDPSSTDFQTAYQVLLKNEVTGVTLTDTGKLTSANKFHSLAVAVGNKDALLSWQVRTWDSDNSPGAYSDKVYFYLTDPPTVTITAPTAGSTQATPRPNVTFNVTTSGGRTVTDATIVVSQAGLPLWSKRIPIGAASGVSKTVRIDSGIMVDGQSYSVQVTATDSQGLKGISGLISFTADWTPPAAPSGVAVSTAHYNVEGEGWLEVTWTNTNNDANLTYFIVYRRDDLINPNTGAVLATGIPKVVYIQYGAAVTTNIYKDYTAPSNYKVNYLVHQVASANTVEVESTNSTYTTVTAVTDGYWLVQTDDQGNAIDAFKLSIVTGDGYTNEQEEAEFIVQGRGRVVNKGQATGIKGSLDARLRDTGIYTARQKKQKVEAIAKLGGNLWLRTPFGDIFRVNVSQISMARIAGVGGSEFCDATIPYAEVSP